MPIHFDELLSSYLVPFVIAVPLAILVLIITVRRGGDEPPTEAPPAAPPRRMPPPQATPGTTTAAPAANPSSTDPSGPAPVAPAAAAPSLLVVDDSAVARAKLRKLFETAGYAVQTAGNGQEALAALATQPFGVMVTDLEMPVMDGFELIAAVQGDLATEDLPIIAITGHDELQARVHDVTGLYGIYKKPWNDRELLKRVQTLATLRRAG